MSFGFAVGDFIAVARLIKRITSEIRDFRDAPDHFQHLAGELDFLQQALKQLSKVNPILDNLDEAANLQRIKTIALHCQGPLKAFTDKMDNYEPFLGNHRVSGGFKGTRRRLHWSMSISKKDVGDLRAIAVSQILAMNTLLNAQQWDCLRTLTEQTKISADAAALQSLITYTKSAANQVELCFENQADIRAKIQQLIDIATTDGLKRVQHFTAVEEIVTTSSNTLAQTMSRYCRRNRSFIGRIRKTASQSLEGIHTITMKLEEGFKVMALYTKEILEAIQTNTRILLELSTLLKRLQDWLPKAIDLPIIRFDDALGNTLALPFQMCVEWKSFTKLLKLMYQFEDGRRRVKQGHFLITNARGARRLYEPTWKYSLVPGDHLTMSMVVATSLKREDRCPFAPCDGVLQPNDCSGGIYTCPKCGRWSHQASAVEEPRRLGDVPAAPTFPQDLAAAKSDDQFPSGASGHGEDERNLYRRIYVIWRCRACHSSESFGVRSGRDSDGTLCRTCFLQHQKNKKNVIEDFNQPLCDEGPRVVSSLEEWTAKLGQGHIELSKKALELAAKRRTERGMWGRKWGRYRKPRRTPEELATAKRRGEVGNPGKSLGVKLPENQLSTISWDEWVEKENVKVFEIEGELEWLENEDITRV